MKLTRLWSVFWLALIGWCVWSLCSLWQSRAFGTLFDGQAFYCAGKAVLAHANPYLDGPLHHCEAAISPAMFHVFGNVTVPSPLPPYALAPLAVFAMLPWIVFSYAWTAVLIASVIGSIMITRRLTSEPLAFVAATMGIILMLPAVILGSLAPLSIALTLLAADALRARRWTFAAIALTGSCIEPHVALPAIAAVFLFTSAMRLRLAIGLVLLAAISIVTVGMQTALAYPHILAAHALSELSNPSQYSLTWLLHDVGVATPAAFAIGSIEYALASIAGIAVAHRLRRDDERLGDAWYILAPAAFAIVGGTFIHITQIGYAMPFLIALFGRERSPLIVVALLLLAMPWHPILASEHGLPFLLLGTLAIVRFSWRISTPIFVSIALATIGIEYLAIAAEQPVLNLTSSIIATAPHMIAPVPPTASADVTWARYLDAYPATPMWIADKVPTWVGLLLMALASVCVALRRTSIVHEARSAAMINRNL